MLAKKKSLVGYIRKDWYREFTYPRGYTNISIPDIIRFPPKSFYFDKFNRKLIRITIEEVLDASQ